MNRGEIAQLVRRLLLDELYIRTTGGERVRWRTGESSDPSALLVIGEDSETGAESVFKITVERM